MLQPTLDDAAYLLNRRLVPISGLASYEKGTNLGLRLVGQWNLGVHVLAEVW